MKPSRFAYAAPASTDEVLALLADAPPDTSLLAGGQSLVPLLNMRLAQPELLIDLNRVSDLSDVSATAEGGVRIGAMVRQRRIETDPQIAACAPLLVHAVKHVAHPAIRSRGTIGGSLCHAEPSAELPCAATALSARMVLRGAGGRRTLPAHEFFVGPMTTAARDGELLIAVEFDAPAPRSGCAFVETARTHGGFALAAAAAVVSLGADGAVAGARLALAGVGPAPQRIDWVGQQLAGTSADAAALSDVEQRLSAELAPGDDVTDTETYRRTIAGVMARRALAAAAARARGADPDA